MEETRHRGLSQPPGTLSPDPGARGVSAGGRHHARFRPGQAAVERAPADVGGWGEGAPRGRDEAQEQRLTSGTQIDTSCFPGLSGDYTCPHFNDLHSLRTPI